MPDRSPASRRRQSQRLWGALVITAVALVVAAGVALRLVAGERHVGLNPVTNCPVDQSPAGFEIILIDASESFNEPQRLFLSKFFSDLELQIRDYTKVAVYVLDGREESGLPEAIFEKCKPPSGKDASEWTQNPEKLKKAWQASFSQPLNAALQSALQNPGSNESPIMGLIQKAVLEEFPINSNGAPRRIILITDLLEHTKRYSQYGSKPPAFDAFRKLPEAAHMHVDLSGVDVEILYVSRPGQEKVQGLQHLEFWKDYFVWLGVGPVQLSITPVPG